MSASKKFDIVIDNNGCFISKNHGKNPMENVNGKCYRASRYIYEQCFGEVPDNMVVRHKCDVPQCINPEHLEIGTQKDNMQDMSKRKRNFRAMGEKNGMSKLTYEQAQELKKLQGNVSSNVAGKMFGVAGRTVRDIWQGRSWNNEITIQRTTRPCANQAAGQYPGLVPLT